MHFRKFLEAYDDTFNAIVKAIHDNPKDTSNILILADYLEERSDPRAESLRILAKLASGQGTDQDVNRLLQSHGGNQDQWRGSRTLDYLMNIPGIYDWLHSHQNVMNMFRTNVTQEILERILPHGSGIDLDWTIEDRGNNFVAHNAYHVMDDNGFYVGWADFSITIPKNDPLDFRLQFHGRDAQRLNQRYMLRDYLEETIHYALSRYLR